MNALNSHLEESTNRLSEVGASQTETQDVSLAHFSFDYFSQNILSPSERTDFGLAPHYPTLQAVEFETQITTPIKPKTAAQLELFSTCGEEVYFQVEALLRKIPTEFKKNHFRKVFLHAHKGAQDDGSIAFKYGNARNKQALEALKKALTAFLDKIFSQYNIDLTLLSGTAAARLEWAKNYIGANADVFAYGLTTARDEESKESEEERADNLRYGAFEHNRMVAQDEEAGKLPFYLIPHTKLLKLAKQTAVLFENVQAGFLNRIGEAERELESNEIRIVIERLFLLCADIACAMGFQPQYWASYQTNIEKGKGQKTESMAASLMRLTDEKYWTKRFVKTQLQFIEHLRIACGEVCDVRSPYISKPQLLKQQAAWKRAELFIKNSILINVDDPSEQVELAEMWFKSNANPAIRRHEMMARLRGVEEWAEEAGYSALFLTLTAPSSFHATHSKGRANRKWQGASPKQTQEYLKKVWAQFRALLAKRKIDFKGMRVSEPHHDGTPHWHILFYVRTKNIDEAEFLFKRKALELDGDEQGASKHRCKVERCDKSKGSATAYIVKYISKNIGGFKSDDKGGDTVSDEAPSIKGDNENAKHVRAWACLWCIRQFQFFGVGKVSVWRELRRMTDTMLKGADEFIQQLQIWADLGEYAGFLDLTVKNDSPISIFYEETGENAYGETTKRIKGVYNRFSAHAPVVTRLKKWEVARKAKDEAINHTVSALAEAVQKETGHSPAWTCVNNCNQLKNEQLDKKQEAKPQVEFSYNQKQQQIFFAKHEKEIKQLEKMMKIQGIPERIVGDFQKMLLLKGATIRLYGQTRLKYSGSEFIYS